MRTHYKVGDKVIFKTQDWMDKNTRYVETRDCFVYVDDKVVIGAAGITYGLSSDHMKNILGRIFTIKEIEYSQYYPQPIYEFEEVPGRFVKWMFDKAEDVQLRIF